MPAVPASATQGSKGKMNIEDEYREEAEGGCVKAGAAKPGKRRHDVFFQTYTKHHKNALIAKAFKWWEPGASDAMKRNLPSRAMAARNPMTRCARASGFDMEAIVAKWDRHCKKNEG